MDDHPDSEQHQHTSKDGDEDVEVEFPGHSSPSAGQPEAPMIILG